MLSRVVLIVSCCAPTVRAFAVKMTSGSAGKAITIDPFCRRQFQDPNYSGTRFKQTIGEVEDKINAALDDGAQLQDGYAPFCKHIFMPNLFGAKGATVEITAENEHLIRSGYESRNPRELPVLLRWFPAESVPAPDAEFLDVILYSREQIRLENEATGQDSGSDAPWGVVGIKAQNIDKEIPMQPITMLRNALGKEEGGSGVTLDRSKYDESVAFWQNHATLK